jgi:diguanylate cyclase (GGDEF)-like protein
MGCRQSVANMDTAPAILATAAVTVAAAAAALSSFGARHHAKVHHGGFTWWLAAIWLTALGTALGALWPQPPGQALATLLVLPWPLLTLVGLRRFQARQPMPGSERGDLALALAATLACGLSAGWADVAAGAVMAATSLVVHLYAAAVLVGGLGWTAARTPATQTATAGAGPLLALAAVMTLTGLLPALAVTLPDSGAWALPATLLPLRAVAATLGVVVMAFVVLSLVAERTERQLRESRRRLRTLANLDALTQVPNRRRFHELASQALRHDTPGSSVLLIFDIDHFKHINDRLGHAAGDRALCLVSSCMIEHLRVDDVAGRHGGDEFVLLLRQATTQDAMRVAARMVSGLQERSDELKLPMLTLSFGMVQVGLAEPLDEALRRADQALYEAKRQGRSRAVAAQGDESEPVFSESRRLGLTAL